MSLVKAYLLTLAILCSLSPYFATKDSTMVITENQWNEVKEGVDFIENVKKEKKNKDTDLSETKLPQYDLSGFKYLFYFLVVGLVLFVIIRITMNWNRNPTIKKTKIDIESIDEIEEKMHEIDLDELLKEAVLGGNYRIALRINFLIVIKLLSQRGDINWAKEKTNWEYHKEVKNALVADKFRQLIMNFEPIWYGERSVSDKEYRLFTLSYDNLKQELVPNE